VGTNGDLIEIIDPHIFADPRMMADFQTPGVFHAHPWFDHDTLADTGSEYAQQPPADGGGREDGTTQHGLAEEEPQRANQARTSGMIPVVIKPIQPDRVFRHVGGSSACA
jgi:hypothetical protein